MRIHIGCELTLELPQTTPMIAIFHVDSRARQTLSVPITW